MVDVNERGERFAREMAQMRIADPSPGRHHELWLRAGAALMVAGLVLALFAYYKAQDTLQPIEQRDALALGIAGVAATIVGSTVYLRYAMTKVLRFWLARVSYDLQARPMPVRPVRQPPAVPADPQPPVPMSARRPPAEPLPRTDHLGGAR